MKFAIRKSLMVLFPTSGRALLKVFSPSAVPKLIISDVKLLIIDMFSRGHTMKYTRVNYAYGRAALSKQHPVQDHAL